MLNPFEEIRFWTGIMRDHGEFILLSLSFNEQEAMNFARSYRDTFSRLHEQSKIMAAAKDINSAGNLISECLKAVQGFICFKKLLLARHLKCQINTSLTPTFYNHMINEAMIFCKTLIDIQTNNMANPVFDNLMLHKIWLPDAAGHAATIASDLDPVEKTLIKEAQKFEKRFNHLNIKTEELSKMLMRTCLDNGALKHLNEEVRKLLGEFICYLDKLRRLEIECKVLSVVKPLIPDHMIREGNYYLHKIPL
jgi:hypothetical protein